MSVDATQSTIDLATQSLSPQYERVMGKVLIRMGYNTGKALMMIVFAFLAFFTFPLWAPFVLILAWYDVAKNEIESEERRIRKMKF